MFLSLLVLLLSAGYFLYTGQVQVGIVVFALYVLVGVLIKIIVPRRKIVFNLFSLFYLVYGLLVLLTQIELIKDPSVDYYVHNDAAMSFYSGIMNHVLPCKWNELASRTLFNPFFSYYPLAAFLMGASGKLGMDIGVENLRLFMRIPIFVIGALIITIMTNLLKDKKLSDSQIMKFMLIFGFFTYIYITSAIFSRDIYVCLVYCLATYICLKDNVKGRLFWFILLFFIAGGLRPVNGLVFLIYPFAYYFNYLKDKLGVVGLLILGIVAIILIFFLQNSISSIQNAVDYYDRLAKSNTGGLFIKFYSLPFPLNTIIMIIYMTLMPLPLTFYCLGRGMTWLNLPYCLSPFVLYLTILVCLVYLFSIKNKQGNYVNLIIANILVYCIIIYGSPDVRRAFAAIPGLFMCFCLIYNSVPRYKYNGLKQLGWAAIIAVQVFFLFY